MRNEKGVFSRRDFLKGSAAAAAAAMLGLSAAAPAFADDAADNGAKDLYILHTNDVHCAMDDNIGYAGVMDAKAALLAAGKEVLLVDSGDFIQGGVAGTLSKGKYLIDIMNLAGYDCVTLGNHEFDYGVDQLFELAAEMDFPVVCANFTDADGNPVFPAYKVFELAGRKIGFVGAVTPTTFTSSTPTYFQDAEGNYIYDFCYDTEGEKLAAALQSGIDAARAEGADKIVVLGHIGVDPELTGSALYGNLQADKLIAKLSGVDLFLDGHSHTVLPSQTVQDMDGKDVVLTQTGSHLSYIGLAIIAADGTVTSELLDDAGMKALIDEINDDMDADLETVVGTSEVDLSVMDPESPETRIVRTQETAIGDFCADAMRVTCNADIGLVNGGGIRADIPMGEVTYGTLLNVFPFNNTMAIRKVRGSELLDALELSVSQAPAEFGGFLQVSGLSFTFDTSIPSSVTLDEKGMFLSVDGDRRVSEVAVNGEPLDEEKEYTVACNDYILKNGGNGYSMFTGEFVLESGPIDYQGLVQYVTDYLGGTIGTDYENPYGEGRIIAL